MNGRRFDGVDVFEWDYHTSVMTLDTLNPDGLVETEEEEKQRITHRGPYPDM